MNSIISVKVHGSGWLLNNVMHVPGNAPGNKEYELIKQWIAEGNEPEAEFTDEEIAAKLTLETYNATKAAKELALNSITVTTTNGNTFDGNETARGNMTSAILSAEVIGKTEDTWKLADNTSAVITITELKEALALSIQEVGRIVMTTSKEEL